MAMAIGVRGVICNNMHADQILLKVRDLLLFEQQMIMCLQKEPGGLRGIG